MKRVFSRILPSVGILALLAAAPAPAHAQDTTATDATSDASDDGEEIVVTGTSIRGVTPAGQAAVGLAHDDIAATHAQSTVQLLTQIPQISGFNSLQSVVPVGAQQTSNLPRIRGLGVLNAGSSPTLLLVDGHRVPGAGITQTVGDPDIIAPGAIERVEVSTDGGSAIYGADAVGGVINLITRRNFDGFEVGATQGFGDSYLSTEINLTAGHRWDAGDAFITYSYSHHDALSGADRDYVRDISYDSTNPNFLGLGNGRGCGEGSLIDSGGNNHLIVGGVPQAAIATPDQYQCDTSKLRDIYPEETRHSVYAGLTQDLNSWLTFDMRAYYMERTDDSSKGIGTSPTQTTITPADTATYPIGAGNLPAGNRIVYYNYASAPGFDNIDHVTLTTWGISPQLTADLGHDWQMRAFLNYGYAETGSHDPGVDGVALTTYHNQINFYDLSTISPTISDALFHGAGTIEALGQDEIVNARAVFDGPVMQLPAGTLRVALGAEYLGENFHQFQSTTGDQDDSRRSHAFFGEASIPIVAAENNIPLINELTLTLAARHDTFSDFGSVTTPKVGITYAPIDWIHFRGNYGQSFQAPSLANTASAGTSRFFSNGPLAVSSFSGFQPTIVPLKNACGFDGHQPCYLAVADGSLTLDAQRAETFSIGTDVSPPFIPGLDVGLTYWHIDYSGKVDAPPFLNPAFFTSVDFAEFSLVSAGGPLSPSDVNARLLQYGLTQSQIDTYFANNPNVDGSVAVVMDVRKRNLGSQRLAGWDAYLRYNHDTSFGSIFVDVEATYTAMDKLNIANIRYGPNTAALPTTARWSGSATVGATIGDDWRARATLLYSPGYDRVGGPTAANGQQGEIDAVHPINLNVDYEGFGPNLSLSLGVNNVLDEDPAHFNGVGSAGLTYGYTGGNLGRVIYLGIDKKF